jgi:hypothetical protein
VSVTLAAKKRRDRPSTSWRTPTAIGLAVATGVPIGLFLGACAAPPFGPILLGWLVALGGAVFLTAGLCILAMDRYVTVGVGYAAGVALGCACIATFAEGVSGMLAAFGPVFPLLAFISLFGSLPFALIKWEDKRARGKDQP